MVRTRKKYSRVSVGGRSGVGGEVRHLMKWAGSP